ncbi:deoxyribodipyrimidine photo-lyase [Abditibacterium utsteinense]|uniref:Deoxyribodipyrimidine photo-lyase n=1 Tax=Abditibacterium utsteinense TaxID=1960156 RepID=A0A2S8STN0_9BACT|nr:deoxyribodipyrimidine photo-lyase [Abditibacterium utsteinense]PQV64150.1 deoxyribodipyrimidine photo-lyase [Abditibacterium utsteinense]
MSQPLHIVWHRAELRVHDHPALHHALELAGQDDGIVVPLVIIDPKIFERSDLTPRRQAHFLENVRALREKYRALGADLIVREGEPSQVLEELMEEFHFKSVHLVRTYTPYAKERDQKCSAVLEKTGAKVHSHGGQYTHEPGEVLTNDGGRYGVFGAYRKKWASLEKPEIFEAPQKMKAIPQKIKVGEIKRVESDVPPFEPGEDAALGRLEWFLKNGESTYEKTRDEPGREESTSKLSVYFNLGVLSPRLAFHRAHTEKWQAELTWWDFYADILDRNPESAKNEVKPDWQGFPWRDGKDAESKRDLDAWQRGETGYPLVDAGMRELLSTGFMHNRVRMVVASFLTKHLLIDWRVGEEIFRGLLLCGDRNQNVGNWQWVAGCGVDPSPYFRVFNPTSQGQKFDADGDYVRRWIPELANVDKKFIYQPWTMKSPPANYPAPIIDLKVGRDRFLETAKVFLKNGE